MAEFEPIIKKKSTSLQNKKVEIKGSNSFGRMETPSQKPKPLIADKSKKQKIRQSEISKEDPRLKASKTQKTSPSTNLKINTLKPFLKETESMNTATYNDIVDMLVDNYVQTKLTTRQNEAYKAIFESQFDML
ncbi:MAG: hypothetical protein R6U04_06165 [Bacteroidales bacterium]